MSQKLPVGYFRFLEQDEMKCFNVQNISAEGSKGYFLEVDLEYPQHLHDSHNDYPLAPESKFVPNEMLSPYAKMALKKLDVNSKNHPPFLNLNDKLPPRANVKKLLTTLKNKQHYVLHIRNLQLYLQLGLKLKHVHKILEFKQDAFLST